MTPNLSALGARQADRVMQEPLLTGWSECSRAEVPASGTIQSHIRT
jgi:hypothetical protein